MSLVVFVNREQSAQRHNIIKSEIPFNSAAGLLILLVMLSREHRTDLDWLKAVFQQPLWARGRDRHWHRNIVDIVGILTLHQRVGFCILGKVFRGEQQAPPGQTCSQMLLSVAVQCSCT